MSRARSLLQLALSLPVAANAQPVVQTVGSCPGTAQVDVLGLTPSGPVAIVSGRFFGSDPLPGGPCAGTPTDLAGDVTLLKRRAATGTGQLVVSLDRPDDACAEPIQVVDLTTCDLSEPFVLPNQTPSEPEVAITPDPALACDTLTCDLVEPSVDPDGTAVIYGYRWFVDGVPASRRATLPAGTATPGQRVSCEVVASDGRDDARAVRSDDLVVEGTTRQVTAGTAGKLDLLFVVDDSCSMGEEQRWLQDAVPTLLADLAAAGSDVHIGVTTTNTDSRPAGALAEESGRRWVDLADPAARPVLQQLLRQGASGSATERPLAAIEGALTGPVRSTFNAGFLRDDASLAVVVATDEPDQSTLTVPDAIDLLDAERGDPAYTALWTISGGARGCTGAGGTADHSPRLDAVALATGGESFSICASPYDAYLSQIVADAPRIPPTRLPLDFEPVRGTLDVTYVDPAGVPRPLVGGTDYRYLAREVAVQLRREPAEGSTLEFSYEAACRP